jgi:glucose/arabinose dehydrogenase
MKTFFYALLAFLVLFTLGYALQQGDEAKKADPTTSSTDLAITTPDDIVLQAPLTETEPVAVVTNLSIPWEVDFLPTGEMVVTERSGHLLRIDENDKRHEIEVVGVAHTGEGGLLGMALHPNFEENNWIYLYVTTDDGENLTNRVERYTMREDKLSKRVVLVDNIPGARFHNGGRLRFGPDGALYVTTGDARDPDSAQDIDSLAGKILRVSNPGSSFDESIEHDLVYSYGHRNPQGLTWDAKGQLWSTEHGRTTLTLTGMDELNSIKKGKNYGWPDIEGDKEGPGMVRPVIHSGPDVTWAPASAAYWDGSIFFGGLKAETLYEATLPEAGGTVVLLEHYVGDFGRIRTVLIGYDGFMYFTTSNTDGRAKERKGDDKIFRVDPRVFRL